MTFKLQRISFIVIGLFLTALGTKLLTLHSLTFGGTAGIATIGSFISHFSWGFLFFIVNLPFFVLSIKKLGWTFSIKTLLCIVLISSITDLMDLVQLPIFPPVLAAIFAGSSIGLGVSLVLNSGASLGGIHILALYLEQNSKINRGITLFATDFMIVSSAAIVVGIKNAVISVIAITIAAFIAGKLRVTPQKDATELEHSQEVVKQN